MRARSLKPGFFKNEVLGSADPLLSILFEGLWCCADREGRLEDRPLRLSAEIFPYRRRIGEKQVDRMLQWLHDQKLIARGIVDEVRYIQVLEFKKHQRPHSEETPSKIPALTPYIGEPTSPPRVNVGKRGGERKSEQDALTPDSLTPDSRLLTPDCAPAVRASGNENDSQQPDADAHVAREANGQGPSKPGKKPEVGRFAELQAAYPNRSGGQRWGDAKRFCGNLVSRGLATWDELIAAAKRYSDFAEVTGKAGTETIQQAATFYGKAESWREPWLVASRVRAKTVAELEAEAAHGDA